MSTPSGVHAGRCRRSSTRAVARRRPRPPRTGRRPPTRSAASRGACCVVVAAVTAVGVLAASASGYAVLSWSTPLDRAGRRVRRASPPGPPASAAGSTTFLLVGSDGRTGMTRADMKRLHVGNAATAAGRRADTMLLVHVSARHGTVDAVSLPRDSYVTIPAHVSTDGDRVPERRNKLNAAYAFGGPALTVATVERTTGVRIDHYLEVDFLGFVRLVDAVGGVDVCSPTRLRDRKAGLRLPAGVNHVDGETGLAYVRARTSTPAPTWAGSSGSSASWPRWSTGPPAATCCSTRGPSCASWTPRWPRSAPTRA